MKTCPVCVQGELERGTELQTFRYKGKTLRYQQPGLWCTVCGEGILTNGDMQATERLLADFRANLDGYLTSAEVRRIRQKLGLTRKRAEEVFGGERQVFGRYESSAARPPRSIDTLLRLLDQHPELLHETEDGLSVLAEASVLVDKIGEHYYEAELYRLKGELTLQQQSKVQGLKSRVQARQKAKGKRQKLSIPDP